MRDILSGEHKRHVVGRPEVFRARAITRRMRGRAQADLVSTDNGLYVVKWSHNPIHKRILVNSLVGAELLRHMGIAVPEWALIYADARFCHNEALTADLEERLHFGLRFPTASGITSVHDFIPYALSHRILNRTDFVRAMIFDCWVDNRHLRRSIFTERSTQYYGQMIGNSYILGFRNGSWSFSDHPRLHLPLPIPPMAYLDDAATASIEMTITQIQKTAGDSLDKILDLIPTDWLAFGRDELCPVFKELVRRSMILPQIVHALLARLQQRLLSPTDFR